MAYYQRGPEVAAVRRERRVGNWGRASEHIGKRWECVGLEGLRPYLTGQLPWPLKGSKPTGWVELAGDDELQLTLSRVGLPSPDVIVALRQPNGSQALQSVDLKWHLEFAEYRQISSGALRDLVEKAVPGLAEKLQPIVPDGKGEPSYVDGFFFAPDTPANREFMSSEQNRRQEYPLEPQDVLMVPVEAKDFFSVLPGWEMALLLAGLDRAQRSLDTIEQAERYYRLGAGLQGATAQLLSSVFVSEPPPVEAEAAFAWLRKTFRARATNDLVHEVNRRMTARANLQERLRELMRSPYRLSDLARTLRKHGQPVPERIDESTEHAARCREVLRLVAVGHREAVKRAGLELVERGASDGEALTVIAQNRDRYLALAQANADRLVATVFADGAKPQA